MLKNSNDASCKDKTKDNTKTLENKRELLNPTFTADEFIPIDKDVPEAKLESRQQRDRSHQKFNHYKANYYNTNRYPNRNGFNSNSSSSGRPGNTVRGHHYKNTHTNYHGNSTNSYSGANAAVNSYNRTKRKRDSSAISVHGEGKPHMKNIPHVDTSIDIPVTNTSTDHETCTTITNCPSSPADDVLAGKIQVHVDDRNCNQDGKENQNSKKKQSKVAEEPNDSRNEDLYQGGHREKWRPRNGSFLTQSFQAIKDKNISRSQTPSYVKSKTADDFDCSVRKHERQDNTGKKSPLEHNSTLSKNDVSKNIQGIKDTGIHASISGSQNPVWYKGRPYGGGVIGLHEEIEDFFQWMVPTALEHENRIKVVNRIRLVIHKLWPHAKVDIFGSFKTGLYLPTSDIDLVVTGKWSDLPLYSLHHELLKSNITKADDIVVLDKAAVPIIKLNDRHANIKVDISFNTINGIRAAELIKFYKDKYPSLPKLIFVLKHFLLQRGLNEVFTGGLSSYALILMAVSFLQLHPRNDASTLKTNLGVLLLEFFDLYGRTFNYSQSAIRLRDGGAYVSRDEILRTLPNVNSGSNGVTLCIEDPLDSSNDVGRGSFLFYRVKSTFEDAYITLQKELGTRKLFREPENIKHTDSQQENFNAEDPFDGCNSILSRILSVSDEIQQFRKNLINQQPISPRGSPKTLRREGSETNTKSLNLQHESNREEKGRQINRARLSGNKNGKDIDINIDGMTTSTPETSRPRCTENDSSIEHTQNTSPDILKHISDDPSAPIYPPRSPTSDIVPSELPSCHIFAGVSKTNLLEEGKIQQVDGNVEGADNKELIVSGVCDQGEDDIMALLNESKHLSKSIRNSSSSSSVSSVGSRASSSVRESMSDTVSIHSCNSSGYGSEFFENTSEFDYKGSSEILNYTLNKVYKSDNINYPTYTKNCITYFDSLAPKNYAHSRNENEIEYIKASANWLPIQLGISQPFPDVYEYHNGNLIPTTKSSQDMKYENQNDFNIHSKHISHSNKKEALSTPVNDVFEIQALLQNIEIRKNENKKIEAFVMNK